MWRAGRLGCWSVYTEGLHTITYYYMYYILLHILHSFTCITYHYIILHALHYITCITCITYYYRILHALHALHCITCITYYYILLHALHALHCITCYYIDYVTLHYITSYCNTKRQANQLVAAAGVRETKCAVAGLVWVSDSSFGGKNTSWHCAYCEYKACNLSEYM